MTEPAAKKMNMIEAINSALDVMLAKDPEVVIMGEDVGYFGGVFRATAGLQVKHGKTRVFDTPISECGIIGVGVGMAAYGLRPVPEIQFADYIYPGLDQLVSIFLAVVLCKILNIDKAVGIRFVGAQHLCCEAEVTVSGEGTGSSKQLTFVLSDIDIPSCM